MASRNSLLFLINHVFLPPKLPQEDDSKNGFESFFTEVMINSMKHGPPWPGGKASDFVLIIDLLSDVQTIHHSASNDLLEAELRKVLGKIVERGGYVTLHVRAQNAGVLISRTSDYLQFETFELSPLNEAAMTTKGRLRRSFPASSTGVHIDVARSSDFQTSVAQTLALMSHQSVAGMQPQARKAAKMHDEERDTTHPGMVTEFFDGFLSAIGVPLDTTAVGKHTREDVLWSNAKLPWRRSPFWLLLRVSLQLCCVKIADSKEDGTRLYKQIMLKFISFTMSMAQTFHLPSEMLHIMSAKLSRRLCKLGDDVDASVLEPVRIALEDTTSVMSRRWTAIQDRNVQNLDLAALSTLNFHRDCSKSFTQLDDFIKAISNRRVVLQDDHFSPSSELIDYSSDDIPEGFSSRIGRDNKEAVIQNLHGFENWVEQNLPGWLKTHMNNETACTQLALLLQEYHSIAEYYYTDNPESISRMVLVLLELWVGCDKIGISICSLLSEYRPGIHEQPLGNLLLPCKGHMERLHQVEQYLAMRERASHSSRSLFEATASKRGFGARYFDQSSELQTLMMSIVDRANEQRKLKVEQLNKLKATYQTLMAKYNQAECDYRKWTNSWNGLPEDRHSPNCTRCSYKSQADRLHITVHEWPLPEDESSAKTVTFELRVPCWYGNWRDSTVHIMLNVLRANYESKTSLRSQYSLANDRQLGSSYFQAFGKTRAQRIGLSSQDKSHLGTHRRGRAISTSMEGDVCLRSGLNYKYYDSATACFVGSTQQTHKLPQLCTYRLTSTVFQRYIFRPAEAPSGPPPNMAIAEQSKYPLEMSLSQGKALSTIPLGYHLGWWNVATQLRMPFVDFKQTDTTLVILQCIYQAGPPCGDGDIRPGHQLACIERFALVVLEQLSHSLLRIKENWESSRALSVFVTIALRLFSLNTGEDIRLAFLKYLSDARTVALKWVHILKEKANSAQSKDRSEFVSRSAVAALICASTFDVDREHLDTVLDSSHDASTLIQCCITIQQGGRDMCTSPDTAIRSVYSRHLRLLRDAFAILAKKQDALHDAISQSWPGYRRCSDWAVIEAAPHWVFTRTSSTTNNEESRVHYNLLNGSLLVSGQPLGRLLAEYENHPGYKRLFGKSLIEVMPSNAAGLRFSAKSLYSGHEINFGMSETSSSSPTDLLVQAIESSSGNTFELVPPRLLEQRLPTSFVRDFVHWYDHCTGDIEFRPVSQPWKRNTSKEWKLVKGKGRKWRFTRSNERSFVVGAGTATALAITEILSPLAPAPSIHLILRADLRVLDIEIPTLRIGFSLEKGDSRLFSREFPGMHVDRDQSLGTLIGFKNRLLLTAQHVSEQKMLLLEGNFSCEKRSLGPESSSEPLLDHVEVSVGPEGVKKIHSFDIDKHLGRLIDNGSAQSKLALAYLHAVTSSCMPDPLTCRTGTEEALTILQSAALRSFNKLSQANAGILEKIADELTPKRSFYPKNERVMQMVEWSSKVGFLSQHDGFHTAVTAILDHYGRYFELFTDSETAIPKIQDVDTHLLERNRIRSAAFRVSDNGAEDHTQEFDEEYISRDRSQQSKRRADAFIFSSHIFLGRTTLNFGRASSSTLWNILCRSPRVLGLAHQLDLSKIRYDGSTLANGSSVISNGWLGLHHALSGRQAINRFNLMMWISTLALSESIDKTALDVIGIFQTTQLLAKIQPPPQDSFDVHKGYQFSSQILENKIRENFRTFQDCPEAKLVQKEDETRTEFARRVNSLFEAEQNSAVQHLLSALELQWPCQAPQKPKKDDTIDFKSYIHVKKALVDIEPIFKTWYLNLELFQYLQRLENGVSQLHIRKIHVEETPSPKPQFVTSCSGFIQASDLFDRPPPGLKPAIPLIRSGVSESKKQRDITSLASFINELQRNAGSSDYEGQYVDALKNSMHFLLTETSPECSEVPHDTLKDYWQSCREYERELYHLLKSSVNPNSTDPRSLQIVMQANWKPRVSRRFFLQQLERHRWSKLNDPWKACLVQFAVAITHCHRAERLLRLSQSGRKEDIVNELCNPGHQRWAAIVKPERLLLEVESKIMIRDIQSDIAEQMEAPKSNHNASMQLNMGEGKSSVIVPIVAAALADGSRLVRVIVGKPQSRQMMQMLISKVGGMLNRRIYHMPFSRKVKLDARVASKLHKLCLECKENGGILLLQPEHILSFQLMGLEKCITGDNTVGRALLRTQDLFDKSSRDIVDESDENFSVKFELIYSMGTQRSIDGSPDRWLCIQEILDLVKDVALIVAERLPSSIAISSCAPGVFPRIRILRPEAEALLVDHLARRICEFGLTGFPVSRQSQSVREAVFTYITKRDLSESEIEQVEGSKSGTSTTGILWTEGIRPKLFLLRGLLACGILVFAFHQKRWRVNYGLDSAREPKTRLAVPYRAKDMPTSRSEFSHPDVVILLTALSYYYGGLVDEDLGRSFSHLSQSDQKDIEYSIWIKGVIDLPEAYRQLDGINLQDRVNCTSTFYPKLRYNKKAVDYFLSNLVFPKEMKEFPEKLSASGWDIGKIKTHPTTAFSGTSDSHILLPVDVDYFDSEEQRHTNGLVLDYLLQPENSVALISTSPGSRMTDADCLLSTVMNMDPSPRVILDAGAQIIEMGNLEVARAWLELHTESSARAVVFFDQDDELSVLSRAGDVEALQTSPFANQLEACLVFLDQAHTRGTDLRLPRDYQAAVTLGPNLTKDRLVQACMRMRQLGKGQSVVFCVTKEISSKIYDHKYNAADHGISVADVLQWAIFETFAETRESMPLWVEQGLRFIRHEKIWSALGGEGGGDQANVSSEQAGAFLEPEAQSLEDRYRPLLKESSGAYSDDLKVGKIWKRCETFRDLFFHQSRLQEEQERELSPEIQQERQVQRPLPAEPAVHSLHSDVVHFVKSGSIVADSKAYMSAFTTLINIGPAKRFPVAQLAGGGYLLATADFAQTIKNSGNSDNMDSYLRPVQWILTNTFEGKNSVEYALIISPFEAQALFPSILQSKKVVLHSYQPRWNRAYDALDQLDFFTIPVLQTRREIPPSLVAQLNIFAGQLYHDDLQEYQETCDFLGLASEGGKDKWVVGADGFIHKDDTGRVGAGSGLSKSPVAFLKAYMKLRKDGESFARTHLGKMLDGTLLSESDFESK